MTSAAPPCYSLLVGLVVGVSYSREDKVPAYEDALRAVGLMPVRMRNGSLPANLDGLVLSGGGDLNPSLYGQEPHPAAETPDDERDAFEIAALEHALERDLPVLAICRGLQLLNVVRGGSLVQHREGHKVNDLDAHSVRILPGTRLAQIAGTEQVEVNSRHHQVVDKRGAGLVISALAPDGVVEGMEMPDHTFTLAVQWHPEDRIQARSFDRKLFEAFRDAVSARR